MARRKTTVYVDEDLLRAVKVTAAREDKKEYEVVEEALRDRLGMMAVLEGIWGQADMDEDQALRLAYAELDAMRAERDGGAASA